MAGSTGPQPLIYQLQFRDADECEKYNNELMSAFQAASAEMYAAQQQAGQLAGGPQQGPTNGPTDNGSNGPTAEDVDF